MSILKKAHPKKIGVYCGSFDPIHNMHLHFSDHVLKSYQMNEIRFIPQYQTFNQNLKHINTSAHHRLQMLQIAIKDFPKFSIDAQKIEAKRPVATLEILQKLRAEQPDAVLVYMISSDVALKMVTWEGWEEIIDYSNILINIRLGYPTLENSDKLNAFIQAHRANDHKELVAQTHGKIFSYPIPKQENVSSSMIRNRLANQESVEEFLPRSVYDYLKEHDLYEP